MLNLRTTDMLYLVNNDDFWLKSEMTFEVITNAYYLIPKKERNRSKNERMLRFWESTVECGMWNVALVQLS